MCASLYIATGIAVVVLSIRVWRRKDSDSRIAKALFPWHARDQCVGDEVSGTIFGQAYHAGILALVAYTLIMTVMWPLKLSFSAAVAFYLRFIH